MKSRRHFTVIDIVTNHKIETQEELCEALRKKGFDVTQATVSRDIKELKLVKIPDNSGYRYALPDTGGQRCSYERMQRMFADAVISVEHNENMVVIKTLPGSAQAVASTIDNSELDGVLGTVAGDDTILVVLRSQKHLPEVLDWFNELLAGGR